MPTLHPRSTRPVLHTRAGPAGPELRYGPHPARSQAPSASSHRQGGSSRVFRSSLLKIERVRESMGGHRRPEFMIHGYITAGCHARGHSIPRPLLFTTILALLTCFLPVFSVWACFLSYFHITTDFHPDHDHVHDHELSNGHRNSPREEKPNRHLTESHKERGISQTRPSHTSHTPHTHKMFGRSRKASVSQTTTKSKPPSTAVTRDSGVSKRRPSTASTSRRRPSNACSAQSLVDPSGKWVTS